MADRVTWGRTGSMGPDHAHWPAQPEAAHAASEVEDDDQGDDREGHVLVTAIVACGLTLAALVIAWGLWSTW